MNDLYSRCVNEYFALSLFPFFFSFEYYQKKLNKYNDDDDRHVATMCVVV